MKNSNTFVPCTSTRTWKALKTHLNSIKKVHLRDLFGNAGQTSKRLKKFSLQSQGIYFDYSKNKIDENTFKLLIALFKEMNGDRAIKDMFEGKAINWTENRSVLHTLLRSKQEKPFLASKEKQSVEIHAVIKKMEVFAEKIRQGKWRGTTGKAITDIVNIGIGGSYLGPKMAVRALHRYSSTKKIHFISNVDGNDIDYVLKGLSPETTLFLIASKTFTTEETMTNAHIAKKWVIKKLGYNGVAKHFACMSTNKKAVENFGIDSENMFAFWDFVGGRYSIWSAIGLPLMISIGTKHFRDFLAGAHEIDEHFRKAPLEKNIPVLLGLLGIWNNNFLNVASNLVIPYSSDLTYFTDYLQQMDMESNGKQINKLDRKVNYQTGNILWGQTGTDSQHSFFQLLHQGTRISSIDFIGVLNCSHRHHDSHKKLLANLFAQSESFAFGLTREEVLRNILINKPKNMSIKEFYQTNKLNNILPHREFFGDRPSTTLIIDKITPTNLGKLIAIYEHKVFVQGIIWGINSFDQWGVELGKKAAKKILLLLEKGKSLQNGTSPHPATVDLMRKLKLIK